MLSGDFGEDFEIEHDDEYDDDDHYEVRDEQYENEESDDDDDRDHSVDTNRELHAIVDFAFSEIGLRAVDDSGSEDSQRSDEELSEQVEVDLANNETSDSIPDDLESEAELSGSVHASASQSTITGLLTDLEGAARSTDEFGSREAADSIGLQRPFLNQDKSTALGDFILEDNTQVTDDQSINESSAIETSANGSSQAGLPANLELRNDQQPRTPTHSIHEDANTQLTTVEDATENRNDDQYGIAAIAWMGSFADDLSAVDEALTSLLADTRSVAEASLGSLLQHGPLLTTGVVTSALAAGRIYQRRRSVQSQLADDHYAVHFDVRLYPELFG